MLRVSGYGELSTNWAISTAPPIPHQGDISEGGVERMQEPEDGQDAVKYCPQDMRAHCTHELISGTVACTGSASTLTGSTNQAQWVINRQGGHVGVSRGRGELGVLPESWGHI